MLHRSTLDFLKSLAKNNNKIWFDANRTAYENAKQDVENFTAELLNNLAENDARFNEVKAKDCMFRLNRDVRFSKDKSPYKTNMGVYLSPGGKKSPLPGYYLHIESGKCFSAAGVWMPEAENLKAIRQEIDYSYKEFNSIFNSAGFKKIYPQGLANYEKLQRPPKGYDDTNPAIEFLKNKSFIVSSPITDDEVLSTAFMKNLINRYKAAAPFIAFLEKAIS